MANIPPDHFLFTSESVTEGHPDKLCDTVSDAVLDACLSQDPQSKVSCETCTKGKMMMLFGEISTKATINYEQIARDTIKDIGYDDEIKGFDYKTSSIIISIDEQSNELLTNLNNNNNINNNKSLDDYNCSDGGIAYGYATNENKSYLPSTIYYSNLLAYKLTEVRKKGILPWVLPDGKVQLTMEYKYDNNNTISITPPPPPPPSTNTNITSSNVNNPNISTTNTTSNTTSVLPNTNTNPSNTNTNTTISNNTINPLSHINTLNNNNNKLIPLRIHTIIISIQHNKDITSEQINNDIKEYVIHPVIPNNLLDDKTIIIINPIGKYTCGGPHYNSGVSGKKTICDTYGGWGIYGGDSFNGKDSSKIDRFGIYIARNIAISLVHNKLCDRVSIQLSYCIGKNEPISIYIDTYNTGIKSNNELINIIYKNYDLNINHIIKQFNLNKPIFKKISSYGQFGRDDLPLPWEIPKKLEY